MSPTSFENLEAMLSAAVREHLSPVIPLTMFVEGDVEMMRMLDWMEVSNPTDKDMNRLDITYAGFNIIVINVAS